MQPRSLSSGLLSERMQISPSGSSGVEPARRHSCYLSTCVFRQSCGAWAGVGWSGNGGDRREEPLGKEILLGILKGFSEQCYELCSQPWCPESCLLATTRDTACFPDPFSVFPLSSPSPPSLSLCVTSGGESRLCVKVLATTSGYPEFNLRTHMVEENEFTKMSSVLHTHTVTSIHPIHVRIHARVRSHELAGWKVSDSVVLASLAENL